jgi:hypothetical protein
LNFQKTLIDWRPPWRASSRVAGDYFKICDLKRQFNGAERGRLYSLSGFNTRTGGPQTQKKHFLNCEKHW